MTGRQLYKSDCRVLILLDLLVLLGRRYVISSWLMSLSELLALGRMHTREIYRTWAFPFVNPLVQDRANGTDRF